MSERMRLRIESLDEQGDGRGTNSGRNIAVSGTIAGDLVETEVRPPQARGSTLWHGSLESVIESSPDRVVPPCRHFGICGGCAVQHLADDAYLGWKSQRIAGALLHEGVPLPADALRHWIRTPPGQRRRVDLTFARTGRACALGLNERASHKLVDLEECPVLRPELVAILNPLRTLLVDLLPTNAEGEIVMNRLDDGIDLLIAPERPAPLDLRARSVLAAFAGVHSLVRIAWGHRSEPQIVAQRLPPRLASLGVPVDVPPGGFLQASRIAESAMQGFVRSWASDARRIVDLYGGVGTLSLPLLTSARVLVVEGDKAALAAVEAGLRRAGLEGRGTILLRDLARDPLQADELDAFDLAIFDPPRAGAEAQARTIAASRLRRAIAVSCNPRSFARDARILTEAGFEIAELHPIDQFLWSPHIELIGLFRRSRAAIRRPGAKPARTERALHRLT